MSTLKYFLDIENKEENKELFKGLYIENSPLMREQGKYPVVFISMKGIKGESFEKLNESLVIYISNLYGDFKHIRNFLDERDLVIYDRIWKREEKGYRESLLFLTRVLNSHYNQQVVMLIDEYDAPLLSAYEHGYYDEAVNFFKEFYGAVLKTNVNFKFGVMTGAIRVAHAGIFSDLNNLAVHTILEEKYDDYFGLLESEVKQILKYYDIEYTKDEVKLWYDGYRFGKVDVYNPWSIINYVDNQKLKAYWINTSGNLLIKNLLMKSNSRVFDELQNLVEGKSKVIFINESVAMGNHLAPNNLWELMLFSGYLTVEDKINEGTYTVRIPNNEVRSFFKMLFVDILFTNEYRNIEEMKQALITKDYKGILDSIRDLVLNVSSYYDLSKQNENAYHMLFAVFLYGVSDFYIVYSNIETGHGRADLILKSKNKIFSSYIFEFKKSNEYHLKENAKRAYEQIENKKYETILTKEEIKDIVKIGLAFDGKRVEGYYK